MQQEEQNVDGGIVHAFQLVMNFLSGCSANPWYRDSLCNHRQAVGNIDTLLTELGRLETIQNNLRESVAFLKDIRTNVNDDVDKGVINQALQNNMGKLAISGTDLSQKLWIYCAGDTIATDSVLGDMNARIAGMEADLIRIPLICLQPVMRSKITFWQAAMPFRMEVP